MCNICKRSQLRLQSVRTTPPRQLHRDKSGLPALAHLRPFLIRSFSPCGSTETIVLQSKILDELGCSIRARLYSSSSARIATKMSGYDFSVMHCCHIINGSDDITRAPVSSSFPCAILRLRTFSLVTLTD